MEGRAMSDKICLGNHPLHICELAEKNDFNEIKKQIKNPQYICGNCGRAADKSENLCNPKHINQIGLM